MGHERIINMNEWANRKVLSLLIKKRSATDFEESGYVYYVLIKDLLFRMALFFRNLFCWSIPVKSFCVLHYKRSRWEWYEIWNENFNMFNFIVTIPY